MALHAACRAGLYTLHTPHCISPGHALHVAPAQDQSAGPIQSAQQPCTHLASGDKSLIAPIYNIPQRDGVCFDVVVKVKLGGLEEVH